MWRDEPPQAFSQMLPTASRVTLEVCPDQPSSSSISSSRKIRSTVKDRFPQRCLWSPAPGINAAPLRRSADRALVKLGCSFSQQKATKSLARGQERGSNIHHGAQTPC